MKESSRKLLHFPIVKIILGIGLCFGTLVAVQNLITKPLLYPIISIVPIREMIVNYISIGVLLASYYYLFSFYDKRKISELSGKKLIWELPGGFIFGFSVLSLVVLILYLAGYYSISGDVDFSYLLAPFSVLVVAALLEEIVFRLIIYRILEEWIGTYRALLFAAILFSLPHLSNDNVSVLSVFLLLVFGFTHGIMYTYTKRLWLPFAFHLGWNFAQPFYGSRLSGIENTDAIIKSEFEGPKIFTGSGFGIEDSIFSILFLLFVGVVFLQLSRKEGKIVKSRTRRVIGR
jgi:uncharacterized protein